MFQLEIPYGINIVTVLDVLFFFLSYNYVKPMVFMGLESWTNPVVEASTSLIFL